MIKRIEYMHSKTAQEHSAILLTFIKLPFVIKTYVLYIFEWPFYTGFTVQIINCHCSHNCICSEISKVSISNIILRDICISNIRLRDIKDICISNIILRDI